MSMSASNTSHPALRLFSIPRESAAFTLAVGAVALHFADDNYVQPAPGTSARDHLASGLIPIAVLTAVALVYPRLRAGARATTAMTVGALAITVGIPGAHYLFEGGAEGDHYTGLLALLAGAVLLVIVGPVTLWRARRRGGSRRRRYLRRALTILAGALLGLAIVWFLVFPIGFAYIYTHTGRGVVAPNLGVPYESVSVKTSDSLELAASYVPSRNRAAVVLYPGGTRAEHARMLIRHGYGVLLLDPRGQGSSDGDTVRWAGDRDLLAGLTYLRTRPDVDPGRIGGFGFSVGGELLLEAAAQSDGFKAIVSEGAGSRVGEEDVSGPARLLAEPNLAIMTAAITVFSNHGPPPPIVTRIGRIAPTSVFLINAEHGIGGEDTRQPKYYAAAGKPKAIWQVPGAKHTRGIDARPKEYERRVIAFFDRALSTRKRGQQ
jgi:dienelactone hydrolase